MALLNDEEIKERLKGLDGWRQRGEYIVKSFDRGDFVGSVKFVDSLVGPAEEMNHHPDISISWSQVEVAISTHAQGGLTENDFELAQKGKTLA
jgi:4a-hydroxytetrahydrobiopterin dehydratase